MTLARDDFQPRENISPRARTLFFMFSFQKHTKANYNKNCRHKRQLPAIRIRAPGEGIVSLSPSPIMVYSVTNYLTHFFANVKYAIPA